MSGQDDGNSATWGRSQAARTRSTPANPSSGTVGNVAYGFGTNTPLGIANYSTNGYWEAATDGGVFAFNAPYYGSEGGQHLNAPVVGITPTYDFSGYFLVGGDGGVFTFA